MEITYVLLASAIIYLGVAVFKFSSKKKSQKEEEVSPEVKSSNTAVENDPLVLEAKARAKDVIVEAKTTALQIQTKAQEQARQIREEAMESERRISVMKAQVDVKEKEFESERKNIEAVKEKLEKNLFYVQRRGKRAST